MYLIVLGAEENVNRQELTKPLTWKYKNSSVPEHAFTSPTGYFTDSTSMQTAPSGTFTPPTVSSNHMLIYTECVYCTDRVIPLQLADHWPHWHLN
jgi:hypothetical protein